MEFAREQIEATLKLSVCGGWDRGFLESVLNQLDRGRTLSPKQVSTLTKVLARNDEDAQQEHQNWHVDYVDKHKEAACVVAAYYARTPYYTAMSREILDNKVPARTPFMKMINNKYAQKVITEHKRAPRFSKGAYVAPRATCDSSRTQFEGIEWAQRHETYQKFCKNGGFVMEVCADIYSAAMGAKRYQILAIGATVPFVVEERFLKVKRK